MTKGRIAVRTNRAKIFNEKTFNLNGIKFTRLVYRITIVSWLCDVIAISVHAANCAIRHFKLLFHVNANVCL